MTRIPISRHAVFDLPGEEGPLLWFALIRVASGDIAWGTVIERAPDSSGVPDESNAVEVLHFGPGVLQGRDPRPADGSTWWYRAFHRRTGWVDGTPNAWVSVTFDDLDERTSSIESVSLDDVVQVSRNMTFDDDGFAVIATNPDGRGMDPTVGVKEGTATHAIYRHREDIIVSGISSDGEEPITFGQTYQNAPLIIFSGGQYVSYSTTIGSGNTQRVRIQAVNVTATGFISRAQIANPGATTPQTDDFASGNNITVVASTVEVNLVPAGANDDTYMIHFFVSVTAIQALLFLNTCDLTVAIDTNDGGGWIERWTGQYSSTADPAGDNTETWSEEIIAIVVLALGSGDDIRLRAKAFTTGAEGGSFIIRGGDAGGSNPEAYNGVEYTTATDTVESAIPDVGDSVRWVAQEVVS